MLAINDHTKMLRIYARIYVSKVVIQLNFLRKRKVDNYANKQ